MTLAGDQNQDSRKLSPTARKMLALREEVFSEWEKRVRAAITEADKLKHPILIDTLPVFYDNIAEAITADYFRTNAVDGTSLANEHGGERARLTSYDPRSLITEFQILRWTILDVLHRHGVVLTHQEIIVINASIDSGIAESANAFSLVHGAIRERFVAALTHDLRGPLGAAVMANRLMLLTTDPAKMKEYAAIGVKNLDRMDDMLRELLDSLLFQSGQRPKLELTFFNILELMTEVQAQAIAAEGPRFEVSGGAISGWWSHDALKRALENVLGNAVKYGSVDTPIRIAVHRVHGRLLLSVHNEGPPIPPEEQETIFQIFSRAKSAKEGKQQGWGIGLPYVRSVVESHGGSITVDSTLERGTTFTIDIPVDCRPYQGAPTSV